MNYKAYQEVMDLDDIARDLGYEYADDMPRELLIYCQHRIAEIWIAYKAPELTL